MSLKLILEDSAGNVTRQIPVTAKKAQLIHRSDSKRLEVVTSTDYFTKNNIKFSNIADLDFDEMKSTPLVIGGFGQLRLVQEIGTVPTDAFLDNEEDKKDLRNSILLAALLFLLVMGVYFMAPRTLVKQTEELKQQVVKIIKTQQAKVVTPKQLQMNDPTVTKTPVAKKLEAIKRTGALSVLGSLKTGSNKAGLNLGAVNTTAGPGLGGTEGSGGVQKSLYAKGITSAPLGGGNNVAGAGGYGTKGKGGGQAGYGSLSLVGAAGGTPVQLGAEAEVATGLDRSQIDEVIKRNLGQVRFCYEQGLQKNASLNGRVVVGFVVGGAGAVKSSNVESSSMGDKLVEECIAMRLKSWKFPIPQGGVDVKVSYPFVLRRQGQG
ncbi:MAG: AgmX/PglI C-terminal domain-containing protein [Bdellovibrio sp.]|nr:AgmX/PglI C-terminal domain-containing protein [Bdellovibrio sp.]